MMDIAAIGAAYADRTLFAGPLGEISYGAFLESVRAEREAANRAAVHTVLHLSLAWQVTPFARLIGLLMAGRSICIGKMPPVPVPSEFLAEAPLLILPTGGTTGQPRHVVHAASRLLVRYQLLERPPVRQLLLFAPDHIAGLDAFFQALHRGATLVLPASRNAEDVAAAIEATRVEVLPATPTYLQFLLLSGALQGRDVESVRAIPHGAEPMPEALRKRVQKAFPQAELLQRFGMTELGALPVRPDPDDPAALFLDAPGHAWKLVDGELWIKAPTRMLGTLEEGPVSDSEWHATGDLAEFTPRGSVHIIGRREALINVGGEKIIPERVEALILQQSMVRDVRVFGRPNPLTGQSVVAEVVYAGSPDPMALLAALRKAARESGLSLAHVPTRLEAVASLAPTPAGKRSRRA